MGLFDSFTGGKPAQTDGTSGQATDADTPIITDTPSPVGTDDGAAASQVIEIQDTDILGNYSPSSAEIPVNMPIEPADPAQISDNPADMLTDDVTLNADINIANAGQDEPVGEVSLDTNQNTAPQTVQNIPLVEESAPQESASNSLFDSIESNEASFVNEADSVHNSMTMDDAIATLKSNLKTIDNTIKDRKKNNADAIKETEKKLRELKKQKSQIESDEKQLEEMEHNLLGTKKPARKTTRKRTPRTSAAQ
ncbi:hypothetical protein CSB09_02095 [Candidatus Gracilibacteria bacterium]|nr:MAG: hypothetical protein CSB09_02095 [Candidatus Gracilibacteria bacterium]